MTMPARRMWRSRNDVAGVMHALYGHGHYDGRARPSIKATKYYFDEKAALVAVHLYARAECAIARGSIRRPVGRRPNKARAYF